MDVRQSAGVLPCSRGRRLTPCMTLGMATPAYSSMVGPKSMFIPRRVFTLPALISFG